MQDAIIEIVEYNPHWPMDFAIEKQRLLAQVKTWVIDVLHVGSTAVYGMPSKPTIDMCMVIEAFHLADNYIIAAIERLGYQYLPELEKAIPQRRYLQRLGADNKHLFHIHIVLKNSQEHINYILFRDYLNAHPDKRTAYAALKCQLSQQFSDNRQAYTDGKAALITELLAKATVWRDRTKSTGTAKQSSC